jgi:hypothetical protein
MTVGLSKNDAMAGVVSTTSAKAFLGQKVRLKRAMWLAKCTFVCALCMNFCQPTGIQP